MKNILIALLLMGAISATAQDEKNPDKQAIKVMSRDDFAQDYEAVASELTP